MTAQTVVALRELQMRLQKNSETLADSVLAAEKEADARTIVRLRGKLQGVNMALGYIEEMLRED